jgi:hypothetical protein
MIRKRHNGKPHSRAESTIRHDPGHQPLCRTHRSLGSLLALESGNRTGTDAALFCQVHAGEGHCRGTAFVDISEQLVGNVMVPSRIERLA